MQEFKGASLDDPFYGSIDIAEKVFSNKNTLQKLMDVEAMLAKVEAKIGLIPEEHAEEIINKCNVEYLDEEYYLEQNRLTGHPLMGLIRSYQKICEGGAGEYIHWGATSQDITDTATMLQLKEANQIIFQKTVQLLQIMKQKATEYKDLVIMGRTNDQQAIPITLGFKIATWIDELDRCLERIKQSEDRIFVGQFSGAVGTMASLGEKGKDVQAMLLKELGLGCPKIAWFATRDRLVELTGNYSILCGALSRIGNEIYNELRTEVDELCEVQEKGQIGSSTMPHKRNPFSAAKLTAYGRMSRSVMTDALQCMESTNERDARVLYMEIYYVKKICFLTDSALDAAIRLFHKLGVNQENINRNIELLQGLIFSEALMMNLGEKIGRMEAHEIIHEIAMEAIEQKESFQEKILNNAKVVSLIGKEEIIRIMNPKQYIGLSEYFAEEVVRSSKWEL